MDYGDLSGCSEPSLVVLLRKFLQIWKESANNNRIIAYGTKRAVDLHNPIIIIDPPGGVTKYFLMTLSNERGWNEGLEVTTHLFRRINHENSSAGWRYLGFNLFHSGQNILTISRQQSGRFRNRSSGRWVFRQTRIPRDCVLVNAWQSDKYLAHLESQTSSCSSSSFLNNWVEL